MTRRIFSGNLESGQLVMLRLLVFHPLDAGLQGDQLLLDVADPFLGLVLDLGMVGGDWV